MFKEIFKYVQLFSWIFFAFLVIKEMTKGKLHDDEYCEEFVLKAVQYFKDDLKEFIGFDYLPEITVGKTVFSVYGYHIFGFFSNCRDTLLNRLGLNYKDTKCIVDEENNEYSKGSFVCINYDHIYKHFRHNIAFKILVISTLAHELTHYKQWLNEIYPSYEKVTDMNFNLYRKSNVEFESRHNEKIFILKHLGKVLKFIILN